MHPADELAYEQNYLESDPLNLDGSAMVDPNVAVDNASERFDAFLEEFNRNATFYEIAANAAPAWKKNIFPAGYEAVEAKIALACKMVQETSFYEAAEFVLKDAIESYEYMEDRITDWATD